MRESYHERCARIAMLPPEIADYFTCSFSLSKYLSTVQKHLQKIYGERADWKKNLNKYYHSAEYLSQCNCVTNIESIPVITVENVKTWVAEEEKYSVTVKQLLDCFPNFNIADNQKRAKAIYKAAEIIGLFGSDQDSLFHHIIDFTDISEEEKKTIFNNTIQYISEFEIIVKVLTRLFIEGRLVKYPVVETVMTQQRTKNLYRGENAFYGSSKPSAFRKAETNEPDWLTARLNDLRREEGLVLLDEVISVVGWRDSNVNHTALAQHYGLKTQMIDVTSDIYTALFFACCCYENNRWRPLKKSEYLKKDSRPFVYKLGGDSRYAILYRQPQEIVDMKWTYTDENCFEEMIFPIGYQPFMRCSFQHGYGLLTKRIDYDLYRDINFGKYRIRLSEDLTNWIFEKMHHGEDVYPNKDVPDLSVYFDRVNRTKIFSRKTFANILNHKSIPQSEWRAIEHNLNVYGYHIAIGNLSFISEQEISEINSKYPPKSAKELTGNSPISDPLLIIDNSKQAQIDKALDDIKYKFMIVNNDH